LIDVSKEDQAAAITTGSGKVGEDLGGGNHGGVDTVVVGDDNASRGRKRQES
jgi:hypothetical protein